MTRVLLLATNLRLTRNVESVPGHHVAALDCQRIEGLTRPNALDGLLGSEPANAPEMIVFGDGIPMDDALAMARSINAAHPEIELVLVAEPNTDLVVRAMRAGIRDILPASISVDELKVLLHRAEGNVVTRLRSRFEPDEVDHSRIIVVAGAKGGVGRSTISSNIAVVLAKSAPMDTVLVDLDLQFGDAGTHLNLKPMHSIADAVESAAALDSLILKTFLTVHSSGFYVLCGASSPDVADKISGAQISHLLRQLSSQFRYVVVDTAAGLDTFTLSAIEEASDLVLVSTMDLSSTRAIKKEVSILSDLGLVPASCHVVVNFADNISGVDIGEVEASIGSPVDVVVPRSHSLSEATNLGEALVARRHGGAVVTAISHIVELIQGNEAKSRTNKPRRVAVA